MVPYGSLRFLMVPYGSINYVSIFEGLRGLQYSYRCLCCRYLKISLRFLKVLQLLRITFLSLSFISFLKVLYVLFEFLAAGVARAALGTGSSWFLRVPYCS